MPGRVIQRYGIDPLAPFNLLYTFGRTAMLNGRYYRPHHAILSEISRARHSIHLCLFLIGELRGEHGESVVDELIAAKNRGVYVRLILNGHLAWEGDPAKERTMHEELTQRNLLPAVRRLRDAGLAIALVYGIHERAVPYSPVHSKQCVIDEQIVLTAVLIGTIPRRCRTICWWCLTTARLRGCIWRRRSKFSTVPRPLD